MSNIRKHLQRLRDHEKKEARLRLAKAEIEQERQAARLEANNAEIEAARESHNHDDPAEVARYHAFRLRMEMVRRREEQKLTRANEKVDVRRDALNEKVRESRTLETLIERSEEEAAQEMRRQEASLLDELGLMGWSRKIA